MSDSKPHSDLLDRERLLAPITRAAARRWIVGVGLTREEEDALNYLLESLPSLFEQYELLQEQNATWAKVAGERSVGQQRFHDAYLEQRKRANDLQEQVQSLEMACDHHKMFWQKAEERERGLKEQLEAYREFYDAHWEVEMGVTDFGLHAEAVSRLQAAQERIRSLASNPATRSDDD